MKSPTARHKQKGKAPSSLGRAHQPLLHAGSERPRHLIVALALSALTLAAFSNSFQAGFILDNKGILLDPRIREAASGNIALIFERSYWWPTGESGLYRPFTTLSYLFNYAVLGNANRPDGYHWINLLLHIGNILLAYALALRVSGRFWTAVFTAALWVVHPALTESVTNIVGRSDLLAAFGVLSSLLIYGASATATGLARVFRLIGLGAVTAIGVFSKESAVVILPVIILYELTSRKDRPNYKTLAYGCLATGLPIAAMLYQRFLVLAASPAAELPFTDNPIVGAGWWTGRITAIEVAARYLWLIVWPAKLSVDYSYSQIPLARGVFVDWLIACLVVIAVGITVILLYRRSRACFFLTCFAIVNFLPGSNLLFPIGTIMADRLVYLPSFGLLGCLVIAIYAAAQRFKMAALSPILLSVMVAAFAMRTWTRNPDWQSEATMANASLRVSPNSFKLHRLLATSLFESDAANSNIDEVIREQEASLALLDSLPAALNTPDVYRQAGYYYLIKGDQLRDHDISQSKLFYERALRVLLRGVSIDQIGREKYRSRVNSKFYRTSEGDAQADILLSISYVRLDDLKSAYDAAERARNLDPLNPQAYRQLAAVFHRQHRNDETEVALTLESAITAIEEGKWQEAAESSDRVVRFNPAEYPSAYYLNAVANLRLGRFNLAEASARQALLLDHEDRNPRTNYVLGLVLARKSDYKHSVELLTAYLRAAPNAPDTEVVRKQLSEFRRLDQIRSTSTQH